MRREGSIQWARKNFQDAELGDARRTRRLIAVAAMIASRPEASLPKQMVDWSDIKAAYRLFDCEAVTFQAVAQPHYQKRLNCGSQRCLIVSDTTEINFTKHRDIPGLGFLGKGQGYGFLLHSALMLSEEGEVLGLAGQELICRRRQVKKSKRTRTQAMRQSRESQLWTRVIDAVGPPPAGAQWIHVGDRGADNFDVYYHCQQQRCGWVIRARDLNRKLLDAQGKSQPLRDLRGHLHIVGTYSLPVRFRAKRARDAARPAHQAKLQVSIGSCQMPAPRLLSPELKREKPEPIFMQIVSIEELDPPDVKAAVNWVLYTSLPVTNWQQAQDVIHGYQHRWLIEEWHKCLKTGCRVTSRQLQTRERLEPLIALLSIQAVRLLSLKHLSRQQPDAPAGEHVPEVYTEVLSRHLRRPPAHWTIGIFVREVAGLGGFLKRKHDGHPGWQTIWDGWQQLIRLVEGYQLAQPPPKCG